MSDIAERLKDLKEKNKALRNFLRQSEDDKKKMENELGDLHI
jgi:septal ring factor EnvC (AmiA/AmiB activator)